MWIGAGVGSMVVGGALVGGGAAMIAIHDDPITGDCEGDNVDALGRCKYLHDTRAGGIAMLSVGVAAIATGVALTVIGIKRRQRARANVAFTGRGVALGVRF